MVNILTGTPFEAVPRLHHRADEVALEGDSSAGSRRALLAARGAMFGRRGSSAPTARSYVQHGLVHLYDGIENVDWGVNDTSSKYWMDLVGGVSLRLASHASWGDGSLNVSNIIYTTAAITSSDIGGDTIELVFKSDRSGYAQSVFGFSGKNKWVSTRANNTINFSYGGAFFAPTSITDAMSVSLSGTSAYHNGLPIQISGSGLTFSTIDGNGVSFSHTYPFVGKVYCARAYSRELTSAEIAYNYAVDAARFGITN